jgi:hypothetical protein
MAVYSLRNKERYRMPSTTSRKAEVRKNWVAPEFKKIGIEQITAAAFGGGSDATGKEHEKATGPSDGSGRQYS